MIRLFSNVCVEISNTERHSCSVILYVYIAMFITSDSFIQVINLVALFVYAHIIDFKYLNQDVDTS